MNDEHEYKHWCGNCQIRIYIQRHEGRTLTWHDCPYTCEYATAMRCSTEPYREEKGDMMSELKPCPFCGGKAEVKKTSFGDNTEYAFITCKYCGASTKHFNKSLDFCAVEEATKAWNSRKETEDEET